MKFTEYIKEEKMDSKTRKLLEKFFESNRSLDKALEVILNVSNDAIDEFEFEHDQQIESNEILLTYIENYLGGVLK